jgi:hypothetical protein
MGFRSLVQSYYLQTHSFVHSSSRAIEFSLTRTNRVAGTRKALQADHLAVALYGANHLILAFCRFLDVRFVLHLEDKLRTWYAEVDEVATSR